MTSDLIAPYVSIEIATTADPLVYAGVFRCADVAYHVLVRVEAAFEPALVAASLREQHRCLVIVRHHAREDSPERMEDFPYEDH